MSRVTNLLLHTSSADKFVKGEATPRIQEVNRFFEQSNVKGLVALDDPSLPKRWYGGSKHLEAQLYVGAFNYLNLEAFIKHLRGIQWQVPEWVQLIVKEQDDGLFRIIKPFDDSVGAETPRSSCLS